MATTGEPAANSATAVEDKNEPARPLALSSPSVHPAEEEEAQAMMGWRSMQYLRKRRCALCCCGCCVTTLVVVGIIALVLALTVFRVKDPRINMNGIWVTAISTGPGSGSTTSTVQATNATLVADVSVKNPNIASLRFSRSATNVYYRGQTISVAYVPAGKVGADRTVRMNITLDLLADRLTSVLNGTGLLLGQEYDLTTYTEMNTRVKVFGIIKKSLEVRMNCSVVLEVGGIAGALVPGAGANSGVQTKGVDCVAIIG
uniref:Late embryogenesis abundant protein LEA-2 subgroup domain-containing protein n=1 Tax=Leersia perrieri TaxID=77586 RepID=A0A0D9WIV7_9ORYZ